MVNEWYVRGPLLAVIIVLGFLFLDCWSLNLSDGVAIKLLDTSSMRGKVFSAASQQQPNTTAGASAAAGEQVNAAGEEAEDEGISRMVPEPVSPSPMLPSPSPAPPSPSPLPPCPSPLPPSSSPSSAPSYELVVPDLSSFNVSVPVLPEVAQQVLELEKQGKGRKIISMSLFGSDLRYTEGAIDNAVIARRFWKDWTLRIHYGDGVPPEILNIIKALGVELIHVDARQGRAESTLWRFFPVMDRTVSRFISRDIDARLSKRDKAAVQEWIDSGRYFHTMHDHFWHLEPVMGGLWGAVGGFVNPKLLEPLLDKKGSQQQWAIDQEWLKSVLWPLVRNYSIDHSSLYCGNFQAADSRSFPTPRENDLHDFVGNVYSPPDYLGMNHSGPCPENCRRNVNWINC